MLLVDDPVYDPADPAVANSSTKPADTGLKPTGPALALVREPAPARTCRGCRRGRELR